MGQRNRRLTIFSSALDELTDLCVAVREWGLRDSLRRLKLSYFRHRYLLWRTEVNDAFDKVHGTETNRKVRICRYVLSRDETEGAVMYWATPKTSFDAIFSVLQIDYEQYRFIDFGCGKARVLLMASKFPFREIVGIDISDQLIEVAKANVARYRSETKNSVPISIHRVSAQRYPLPPDDSIIYLFNPFSASILDAVIQNIAVSLRTVRHDIILIYLDPSADHLAAIKAYPFLRQSHAYDPGKRICGEFPWYIYRVDSSFFAR